MNKEHMAFDNVILWFPQEVCHMSLLHRNPVNSPVEIKFHTQSVDPYRPLQLT